VWDEEKCLCTAPISETLTEEEEKKFKTCPDGTKVLEGEECPKTEKKDPFKVKPLEGNLDYKNTSSFMDKIGNTIGRLNVGDIMNIVDSMRDPKQFTATFSPMQATTLSKRKVQNMAGYDEMKSQLEKPTYDVKTSDLMAKAQLQKRNQNITNQKLTNLYAQNAQNIENQKNANLQIDNQNKANLTQTRNMNNQQLNQRELMDAKNRAQNATLVSKRKAQLWGSIGNRLQSGVEESLVDRSYDKLAKQSHIMSRYSTMKNKRAQEINKARENERNTLAEKYKTLSDEDRKNITLSAYIDANKDKTAYYNKSDDDIFKDFSTEFSDKYGVDPSSDTFEAEYTGLKDQYKKRLARYSKDPKNA